MEEDKENDFVFIRNPLAPFDAKAYEGEWVSREIGDLVYAAQAAFAEWEIAYDVDDDAAAAALARFDRIKYQLAAVDRKIYGAYVP